MKPFNIILAILALIFSTNIVAQDTTAQNKVVVIPLIENAPPSNTVYVKSKGTNIGVLINAVYEEGIDAGDNYLLGATIYKAYSSKGYLFEVNDNTGLLGSLRFLFFTSSDCTGPAYHAPTILDPDAPPFQKTRSTGLVHSAPPNHPVPAYYEKTGATTVTITPKSIMYRAPFFEEPCAALTGPELGAYPLLPNDPAVTGVKNSYSLPITTGF